jgi:hypothetical protein
MVLHQSRVLRFIGVLQAIYTPTQKMSKLWPGAAYELCWRAAAAILPALSLLLSAAFTLFRSSK